MIKAVLFDMDDCLFSQQDFIHAGFHHIANEYYDSSPGIYTKLCELYKREQKNEITAASHKIFDKLMTEMGIYSKEKVMEMVYAYRTHQPRLITCFEWVKPLLKELREQGTKIGLITNGKTMPQYNKIMSLGIAKFVDKYLICDVLGEKYYKPHPLPYRIVCEWLHVKPADCLYVDDNQSNVDAACELGMQGIHSKNPDDIPKAIKRIMHEKNMGSKS